MFVICLEQHFVYINITNMYLIIWEILYSPQLCLSWHLKTVMCLLFLSVTSICLKWTGLWMPYTSNITCIYRQSNVIADLKFMSSWKIMHRVILNLCFPRVYLATDIFLFKFHLGTPIGKFHSGTLVAQWVKSWPAELIVPDSNPAGAGNSILHNPPSRFYDKHIIGKDVKSHGIYPS